MASPIAPPFAQSLARSLARSWAAALLLSLGLAAPASAHPHIWVTSKAEFTYGDGGKMTGIRHAWTFDKSNSALMTQGRDADGDGKLSSDELAELAQETTAALAEFAYFTKLKIGGKQQAFADPTEPRMMMGSDRLTLSFLLPLKVPVAQGRGVAALEVYDPVYYFSFSLSDDADAARLVGAPAGCTATMTRPKPEPPTEPPKTADAQVAAPKPGMTQAFFEALTEASTSSIQFPNRILVACP